MKKSYNITDPALLASLDVYMSAMIEQGYSEGTIRDYVSNAGKYLETGRPLTKESIEEYIKEKLSTIPDPKKRKRIHTVRSGIMRYFELFDGCDTGNIDNLPRSRRLGVHKVCDEDCFNCKYPDCIFV